MCKVSGADGSVDLIDPSSSGIRLHLLVAPFGDPVHLQIETAILRIDSAKRFKLTQCFRILSTFFQVADPFGNRSHEIAALRDSFESLAEMGFLRIEGMSLGKDRYPPVKIRFGFHFSIDLDDV